MTPVAAYHPIHKQKDRLHLSVAHRKLLTRVEKPTIKLGTYVQYIPYSTWEFSFGESRSAGNNMRWTRLQPHEGVVALSSSLDDCRVWYQTYHNP